MSDRRLVLVDPDPVTRGAFSQRLRAQGYIVDEAEDGVAGAEMALAAPPHAVVSDLWMPGVSGVQLTRLLRAEPATEDVPVILRSERDDARSRFWSRRAGACRLVMKGRMGELVRALSDVITESPAPDDAFFFRLGTSADVRDRIAQHLDRALFESTVAAEVRALASATTFERLFDSLSQLVTQLIDYRWMSLTTNSPSYFAVHAHRQQADAAAQQARQLLEIDECAKAIHLFDDDAVDNPTSEKQTVHEIRLGAVTLGKLAFGLSEGSTHADADAIAPLVAGELGAVIRLVLLIEESQRLATTDVLTGILNRRAFVDTSNEQIATAERLETALSFLVLDLDHFKAINDTHGHKAGDLVLSAIARTLSNLARPNDLVGRWGGEEFVVSLPYTTERQAGLVAEKLRAAIAELSLCDAKGDRIPLTASIGVAERRATEQLEVTVDRADRAMYRAKVTGRNRVSLSSEDTVAVSIIPTRGPRISYGPAARRGAEVLERLLERAEQPHF